MSDEADALEQLAKMHERSLITDAEYDAKRREILGRLGPAPAPTPAAVAPSPPAPAVKSGSSSASQWAGAILIVIIAVVIWNVFSGGSGSPSTPSGGGGGAAWTPPAGFTQIASGVAGKWVSAAPSDCYADHCWALDVVTKDGCDNTLYVEVGVNDAGGKQVDYANDVASKLSPGQHAALTFQSFDKTAANVVITKVSCY